MSTASSNTAPGLDFEQPLLELEARRRALEQLTTRTPEEEEELRQVRRAWADTTAKVYAELTPWQVVQVARHKDRPYTADYVSLVFEDFVELHGDRRFGDDRAILTGFARLDQYKVLVVGHQKGRTYKDRTACYFGCAHPEGYRKAILKMKMAEKYGIPVICLIDTPGAYPGIGAEERGQSQAIAENMYEMSRLKTPIICVVIGEGGSGGALGIGVGDRVAMLQYSYYSVISPEGCAGILWKSHQYAELAAQALKFTSNHLSRLGVVDQVIEEPLGGAHRDHHQTASRLKQYLLRSLRELTMQTPDQLVDSRYEKFRRIGVFLEEAPQLASANGVPQE
ncbi:acetyl-CoA carboxylase, carboxyl transferase, alpha subunit [Pirellula staleyi DSM 6068]|uniref:Acetyl-coenzyme A carboxylase carboxyl transferase subunit alpha n=1 Tax=Pirellula staleyi (strain ATCC 27377 / DSM 6068 / ICPB 4128) TaxID=530564 RepID=D2R421_PIRSD|nr:acetyl-CoA carboxylase carboxyltransferase subunit alpha [Pirellula staleyi]ADB18870.1 acetyl-CoA carboxylase, carboxyl transferase, alpha subunit [Pirellula staleyi DSM 6068]